MSVSSNNEDSPTVSGTGWQGAIHSSWVKPKIEDYEILGRLGEGGMGTVWRAVQLSTRREVALKVISPASLGSEKAQARFEREVELVARLEHPNIARIYDSGLHRGVYYYAMELFDGEHLDKYVKGRELTLRQILELMHTVCRAVKYAHQRLVIHRDLTPSNIVVTSDGQPHILDFGLAKALWDDDRARTVSLDGEVFGTLAYMSPEQAGGYHDQIDTRTDVYSLGVILFRMLTNHWPYDLSGPRYEALKNIQEQEPTRPSKIIPRLGGDVEAILMKALAKEPSERYQSAAELAHDIQCWLQGLPVSARAISTLYLLRKSIVRHRTVSTIVGLLLVIIVSTSFISLYFYKEARGALKDSQLKQDAYQKIAKRNLTFANQVVFALFLEMWYDGKIARAKGVLIHFADKSRERMAADFLLDPRPLDEKHAEYQEKLSAEQPSFWQFILGEYHLEKKDIPAAVEAYRRCIALGQESSELDDWFVNRAKRKLNELANENIPLRSCADANVDK